MRPHKDQNHVLHNIKFHRNVVAFFARKNIEYFSFVVELVDDGCVDILFSWPYQLHIFARSNLGRMFKHRDIDGTVNHPMVENHLIVENSQKYKPNWPAMYFFLLSSGCKLNQKSFIQVLQNLCLCHSLIRKETISSYDYGLCIYINA